MQIGVCGKFDEADRFRAAGADYLEFSILRMLQPEAADADWVAPPAPASLPTPAALGLVPPDLPIVGESVDQSAIETHLTRVLSRLRPFGVKTIVFGSGPSRRVPDGFPREKAWQQLIDFARLAADLAARTGLTIVLEPLNRRETNIVNSVYEGATLVRAVDRANFSLLADSYHLWAERESFDDLATFGSLIRHVHVADDQSRTLPGETGHCDYRAFFAALKRGGYAGPVSIEARGQHQVAPLTQSIAKLRSDWDAA